MKRRETDRKQTNHGSESTTKVGQESRLRAQQEGLRWGLLVCRPQPWQPGPGWDSFWGEVVPGDPQCLLWGWRMRGILWTSGHGSPSSKPGRPEHGSLPDVQNEERGHDGIDPVTEGLHPLLAERLLQVESEELHAVTWGLPGACRRGRKEELAKPLGLQGQHRCHCPLPQEAGSVQARRRDPQGAAAGTHLGACLGTSWRPC